MKDAFKKVGFMFGVLLLVGAGCTGGGTPTTTTDSVGPDDFNLDDYPDDSVWTAHDSVIIDGFDIALEGVWRLESQVIVGTTNPFSGHLLTISDDGAFSHDYSSTYSDRAPNCEASGSASGSFFNEVEIDLDVVEDHETAGTPLDGSELTSLLSVTSLSRSGLNITCPGADVDVSTNAVPQPLGTGRGTNTASGPAVRYNYTLDQDWENLQLNLEFPAATYNYVRVQ